MGFVEGSGDQAGTGGQGTKDSPFELTNVELREDRQVRGGDSTRPEGGLKEVILSARLSVLSTNWQGEEKREEEKSIEEEKGGGRSTRRRNLDFSLQADVGKKRRRELRQRHRRYQQL